MKKNPKVIAGIAGILVLTLLLVILGIRFFPTVREVRREMSLTPTPLPPEPASARWKEVVAEVTPEPPLHNGSTGEKVLRLQERLQELGFYAGEVDGQFGPGTREAVVAFQQQKGLTPDGLAGEETLAALYGE